MKRLVTAALTAVLLLAACGGSGPDAQENPKDALVSAFENMAKREGHEITLSLDATVESLQDLAGSQASASDPMSDEDIEKILNSEITIRMKGKGTDAQMEMVAVIDGEEDLTMKAVDQNLYFQADAEGLAETFGTDPAELETAADQAEAQGLDFVRPALEGEWVAVTGFQELQEQLGGPSADEAAAQQEKLLKDMTEAVKETARVNHIGDDDAGEHLAVSLPIRDLYTRMMTALQGSLGPAGGLNPFPEAGQVPDENVVLDVWVEDDAVTQVAFNLHQIEQLTGGGDSSGKTADLLIVIDEFDDDVTPPEDAVEVEAQQLMQIFGGMMMQGGSSGGGSSMPGGDTSGFDCSQLEGAPPNVLKQFADACPELQTQ